MTDPHLTAEPDPVDPGDVVTVCAHGVPTETQEITITIECDPPVDPAVTTVTAQRADESDTICFTWNVPQDFTGATMSAEGFGKVRVSRAA